MFFSPFSIAITSLWEERASVGAFRMFVRFALVWFCLFPLPLGVWEGLRFVIVAFPGLFSYRFFFFFFFFSKKKFAYGWNSSVKLFLLVENTNSTFLDFILMCWKMIFGMRVLWLCDQHFGEGRAGCFAFFGL